MQPSQLPFQGFDLLHQTAEQNPQLRNGLFVSQRFGFPVLLPLERTGMESPIIMRGPAIASRSPDGGRLARRGYRLVKAEHCPHPNRGGAVCPAQNAAIGGLAECLR